MKLYRFSVYDLLRNEVILRYYLERSNVTQLYHVLCFTCENYRGQVHPYGTESPSYWEVRQHMLQDVYSRLLSALSQGSVPAPQTHASTIFPATRGEGPVIIQVPTSQPLTAQQWIRSACISLYIRATVPCKINVNYIYKHSHRMSTCFIFML